MAGTSVLSLDQDSASSFLSIPYGQRLENLMQYIPAEFAIGGVFLPPLLPAAILGAFLAHVTGRLMDRYRLSRHFFYPPLVSVSLTVIYTVLVATFLIPG